jgi:hypothetical protein
MNRVVILQSPGNSLEGTFVFYMAGEPVVRHGLRLECCYTYQRTDGSIASNGITSETAGIQCIHNLQQLFDWKLVSDNAASC